MKQPFNTQNYIYIKVLKYRKDIMMFLCQKEKQNNHKKKVPISIGTQITKYTLQHYHCSLFWKIMEKLRIYNKNVVLIYKGLSIDMSI